MEAAFPLLWLLPPARADVEWGFCSSISEPVSTPGVLRGHSGGSLVPASGPLDCKVTVVLQLTPCADSILLACFLSCGWRPCSALGDAVYSSSSPAPPIPHPQSLSTPFKIPQFPMLDLFVLIKAWMFPSSWNLTNHHGTPLLRLQNQASVSSSRMIDLLCQADVGTSPLGQRDPTPPQSPRLRLPHMTVTFPVYFLSSPLDCDPRGRDWVFSAMHLSV